MTDSLVSSIRATEYGRNDRYAATGRRSFRLAPRPRWV